MIEQQTNNEHQIHIDVLPTDKFKDNYDYL